MYVFVKKAFFGDQCERNETKLILSFNQNLNVSSPIFIHFIEVKLNSIPTRTTTFKNIPTEVVVHITIRWSLPFHLIFAELTNNSYYLVHMQIIENKLLIIEKSIESSDQCFNVSELFNQTIANLSLLRRIKYYHFPCQRNLSCFYDEIHLCICQKMDQGRVVELF